MSLECWVYNPLAIIEEIFERRNGTCMQTIKDFFKGELANDEIFKKIPYMSKFSISGIKDLQVVKFRGMVQDILNPEYYLQTYELVDNNGLKILKSGLYKDELTTTQNTTVDFDSPNAITGERQVYCLIPIPGENRWTKELLDASYNELIMQDSSVKRQIGEVYEADESEQNSQKKSRNGSVGNSTYQGEDSTSFQNTNYKPFPFEESNNISCLAKIYDELELKLNDVVEIVGIVNLPSKNQVEESMPGSVIRIHSLHTRKLQHYNPLIDNVVDMNTVDKEWMRESRELLLGILQEALFGDCLAAEYLILHLISSVYMRQDMLALGSFSLNLTGVNQNLQKQQFPRRLFSLLQSITTHSNYLPMTIDNINNLPFIPKKDYEVDRLCSGVLQLPANSHLVLDETKLSAGQLNSKGVQNITALGNLINWQKVDVDFKYYTLEQHSNVSVLILSEGKSISESNCRLKFNPSHCDVGTGFKHLQSLLTEENLKTVRCYLTVARLLPYILSDNMKNLIEDHFVSSRRNSDNLSVDDLHQLLVMGRLVSISCGEKEMTADIWKSAQILVKERNNREKT